MEYKGRALNRGKSAQASDLNWVVEEAKVQMGGRELVIANSSVSPAPVVEEDIAGDLEVDTPLWGKIAMTGTAGLIIGAVGAVVVNKFLRARKPQAYWSAYERLQASPGVMRTCGKLERSGEHELIGQYDSKKADFYFMFKGANGEGRAYIRAALDGKEVWRFDKISVDVASMKRPIRVEKGE